MAPGELDMNYGGSDRREEVDRAVRGKGDEAGETNDVFVREIDIDTANMSFRAIDVALSRHRSLTVVREVHEEYLTKIRNQRSGYYIKFSQGGLLGGVLGSRKDGLLNVQNFVVTRQANPGAEPEYVFCCRIFVEREGFVWFLSYIPNAQSGARIQFQPFDKDEVTSSNIDGRCFVRRELGDDVLFGSYFNEDLFMVYDRKRGNLFFRRVRTIERAPPDFRFTQFTQSSAQSATTGSKIRSAVSGLVRRIPCVSNVSQI